ncbi:MAG TPA: hypothetical protein VFK69_06735 [Candidatus Eisenbacteria bacterium]|nr:hypothetical protein [Candidatus Eisenbacteria bacterium]
MSRWPIIAFALVTLASPRTSFAQGTARSLDLDPSPISAGMGGASNAVFWGDPNHWANPALLAYHDGLRYEHMREQLVPDLSSDVFFTTDRYIVAAGGVGASLGGYSRLDYGPSMVTDESGNVVGIFSSYEKISSWGVGVSAASLVDGAARLFGRDAPGVGRFVDVAFGYNRKHVDVALAPILGAQGSTPATDIGVLVRMTPFDGSRMAGAALPLRIDASYGHSIENSNDAAITFLSERAPTSRIARDGAALRTTLGWPEGVRMAPWLLETLTPMISLAGAFEHESVHAGSGPESYHVTHAGLELGFAHVAWLRFGHVEDRAGDIVADTFGWGVGFETPYAGIRYDEGSVPEAAGLSDVHRRGFFVSLQPLRIVTRATPHGGWAASPSR